MLPTKILCIGPLGTNFNKIFIEVHTFSFKTRHLKMSSGKLQQFCLCLNVMTIWVTHMAAQYSDILKMRRSRRQMEWELFSFRFDLRLMCTCVLHKFVIYHLSFEQFSYFHVTMLFRCPNKVDLAHHNISIANTTKLLGGNREVQNVTR